MQETRLKAGGKINEVICCSETSSAFKPTTRAYTSEDRTFNKYIFKDNAVFLFVTPYNLTYERSCTLLSSEVETTSAIGWTQLGRLFSEYGNLYFK
jgi:hypothetical protein